jgi:hypothetical protein
MTDHEVAANIVRELQRGAVHFTDPDLRGLALRSASRWSELGGFRRLRAVPQESRRGAS